MRSCLSLNAVDETVMASLKVDMERLEDETRQLEQTWKDSLWSSPADHYHCHHADTDCQLSASCVTYQLGCHTGVGNDCQMLHYNDSHCRHPCDRTTQVDESSTIDTVCQLSANCVSNEASDSDCRHLCDRTTQVDKSITIDTDCRLSDNCITNEASDSDCRHPCDRTTQVDESSTVDRDISLYSDSYGDVSHISAESNLSLCMYQNQRVVKTDSLQPVCHIDGSDRQGVKCRAIKPSTSVNMTPASVTACSISRTCLSRYQSCCSKLQQLFSQFQSVMQRIS